MKMHSLNKINLNLKNLTTPLLALSLMASCVGLFGGSVSAASVTKTVPITPAPISDDPEFSSDPPAMSSLGTLVQPTGSTLTTQGGSINVGMWRLDTSAICSPARITAIRLVTDTTTIDPNAYSDATILGTYNDSTGGLAVLHMPTYTIAIGDDGGKDGVDTGSARGWNNKGGTLTIAGPMDVKWSTTGLTTANTIGVFVFNDADHTTGQISTTINKVEVTYDNSSCPVITPSPDTSTTLPSTPVTINVLGNDEGSNLKVSKIDGQDIVIGQTITLTNGSGTVKLNTDGTITFTPASTFQGESSFSYSITDGTSTVDTGAVKVTVASATAPEPVKPSQNNPTSTTKTNTASAKPMLANTGENMSALAVISATLLTLVSYLRINSNKKNRSYIKR